SHIHLAEHAKAVHSSYPGQYDLKTLFFNSSKEFESWRRETEDKNVLRWATNSAAKRGQGSITYYRCSRALPTPQYGVNTRPRSKKKTKYCTAFMQVAERNGTVRVQYCSDHAGHEKEPGLLTLDNESESFIVSLLREGFGANQILKKIRSAYREDEQHRIYYTTSRDIRNIAIRNKLQPGRRHEVDLMSLEIRVKDGADEDGIRLYIPAFDESGEGFLLGDYNLTPNAGNLVITPIQKEWLLKYASRAICVDDTFNLTCYSLRLATIVVVDEYDKGLPAAYLLSNRMTEAETEMLFEEVRKSHANV
ncbi:hypothetical protein OSTOST_12169, partial [Ostertagia ostertagi]